MNLLRNRPLAACSIVFLLTLTVAANTDSLTKLCLGGAAVLFLLPAALIFRRRRARPPLLLPVCVLLLLFALLYGYLQFDRRFCMADEYEGEVEVCARVREITYTNGSTLGFTADCETVAGRSDDRRIAVWAYTDLLPEEGDCVRFHASLQSVAGEDSQSLYLRADGVAAQADDVLDLSLVKAEPRPAYRLRALFADLRSTLGNRLSNHIPGESGLLMRALLLGERKLLPDQITLHFRRTGLSHVLSLSGLHISLLVSGLATLCRRLRCPRSAAVVGQVLLVLFYMALTGFSLSITRAGLMMLLYALSFFARRGADGFTSLSLAAVLILLFSPTAVYDCGYWLSVVATYGILIRNEWRGTAPPPSSRLGRIGRAAGDSLCVTLAATLATLPLTAAFFGEISLLSPLANLLLIPCFNLYLLLSVLALPLAPLSFFSRAVGALGQLLLAAVKQGAFLPGVMLSLGTAPIRLLLFALLVLLFACLCSPVGRKRVAAVSLCSLTVLALLLGTTEICRTTVNGAYYGYAGENEMLLLQSGRKGLLFDLSNGSYTAQKNGLHAAKQAQITELEGYFLTHYHSRHATALPRLCGQIMIRTLYLPIPQSAEEEAIYRTLLSAATELGMNCVLYEPYRDIAFGRFTVHPHAKGQSGALHPTVALSVRHGEELLTYLGAGHHESDQQGQAASAVAKSSLLILGVHGGKEESLPDYRSFSPALSQVMLPYKERITPALAAFLDTRLRIAAENDLVWISL